MRLPTCAIFALALLAPIGAASMPPELVCDPDARVTFHSRWVLRSTVRLEAESTSSLELPWSGREPLLSGREIRPLGTEAEGLLSEDALFLAFTGGGESRPSPILYIGRDLWQEKESDGLVIAWWPNEKVPSDPGRWQAFHCRSR